MIYVSLDAIGYTAIFIILTGIAWLSHREIRRSMRRAGKAERSLEDERDLLERRVAERTEALIEMEHEQSVYRARMVSFGELSQGLFHDLMNPLSSLSLYLERLESSGNHSDETRKNMGKIVDISRRMNSFMESVKRSLGRSDASTQKGPAVVARELEMVRDILAYKARMGGVRIVIEKCDPVSLAIHPVRLHQLLVNLVSNGIEACNDPHSGSDNSDKWVRISVKKEAGTVVIRVADNGSGISADRIPTLFKDPVSTKSGGVGIGLSTVKSIVENELHGTIAVKSTINRGTVFSVTVPQANL